MGIILAGGRVDFKKIITDRFPLAEAARVFETRKERGVARYFWLRDKKERLFLDSKQFDTSELTIAISGLKIMPN